MNIFRGKKKTTNIALDSVYLMSTDGVWVTRKPTTVWRQNRVVKCSLCAPKGTELIDYYTASESDVNQRSSDNYTDNMAQQQAVNDTKHTCHLTLHMLINFIHEKELFTSAAMNTIMFTPRIQK
jgi:methyl coenzyme M reductase alpha subunit